MKVRGGCVGEVEEGIWERATARERPERPAPMMAMWKGDCWEAISRTEGLGCLIDRWIMDIAKEYRWRV